MTRRAPWSRSHARTYAAWERFAAGDEHPEGVPLAIATSWHRCRDVYRLDPRRVPSGATEDDALYGPAHATLFAELGGLAAALTARHGDCLTTVTDGRGCLVSSRGSGPSGRRARDTGLVPTSRWAETTAGTNAIGTALVARRAVGVCGPEHWSSALHDWSCTSLALCDARTGTPLATLTVAAWKDLVPSGPSTCSSRPPARRGSPRVRRPRPQPRRGAPGGGRSRRCPPTRRRRTRRPASWPSPRAAKSSWCPPPPSGTHAQRATSCG